MIVFTLRISRNIFAIMYSMFWFKCIYDLLCLNKQKRISFVPRIWLKTNLHSSAKNDNSWKYSSIWDLASALCNNLGVGWGKEWAHWKLGIMSNMQSMADKIILFSTIVPMIYWVLSVRMQVASGYETISHSKVLFCFTENTKVKILRSTQENTKSQTTHMQYTWSCLSSEPSLCIIVCVSACALTFTRCDISMYLFQFYELNLGLNYSRLCMLYFVGFLFLLYTLSNCSEWTSICRWRVPIRTSLFFKILVIWWL